MSYNTIKDVVYLDVEHDDMPEVLQGMVSPPVKLVYKETKHECGHVTRERQQPLKQSVRLP